MPNPCRTQVAPRRGVAASELAVCLPVIVLLVLGMIEACTMIFLKQSLTVAAYEGTRAAIVPGATSADVRAACNQVLADRRVRGGTVTLTPADITSLQPGQYVDVTVSAPCSSNTVAPHKFFSGRTLSAVGSMMIEY
ncbi:MAG TPA: TadE/TadG family type IV pilus assembly protein [Lacipirellulaceae bacterium]|nr:TadE/TadG family type IV pilus assembly protein [Lacipirellulaceae bacterium]